MGKVKQWIQILRHFKDGSYVLVLRSEAKDLVLVGRKARPDIKVFATALFQKAFGLQNI